MEFSPEKLTDLGGVFVIALLLIKIIWNDLRHLNASAERIEIDIGQLRQHAERSEKHLETIARAHEK